jgi:hypothetical protein
MKQKIAIILLTVITSIGILASFGAAPTFKVSDWQIVRASGLEDAANSAACLATATASNYANISATAFRIPSVGASDTSDVRCILSILGGAAANENFSFVIYGYAVGGPAEFICEGDGILGAQTAVAYPNTGTVVADTYWADTINIDSTTIWVKGVYVTDSGNDRIAHLCFDTTGLAFIKVYFYDANGATTEAGPVMVYARFY